MERLGSDGEPRSAGSRVFEASGCLSPHPSAEPAGERPAGAPPTATVIAGLEPHTEYRFRVSAENGAGSVSSAWASGRTGESGEAQALNSTLKTPEGQCCLELTSAATKVGIINFHKPGENVILRLVTSITQGHKELAVKF